MDIQFEVPFTHRLRFTSDVFGDDRQVLADVLEPSGDRPARVQFWVDEHVLNAQPDLRQNIHRFYEQHHDRIIKPGSIQIVPGGEAVKNDIHIFERMLKVINHADLDRRSYIVVIGGGAVLDAVGFAAAIAHRGIRLVRLPTTTLSQDDSGVGVKNSCNLFGKKNWVGTFAVPWAVINDAKLLETLPDRDFVAGFSEAVKVSLLKDAVMFNELCELAPRIAERDPDATQPMIKAAAMWHLRHITRGGDPFEMLEARPLDYGHWSAHKLEAMTNFEVSHGEAVAIGVAIDTVYSAMRHGLDPDTPDRVLRCLDDLRIPLYHPMLADTSTLRDGLEEFRQHLGGRLTLTMLRAIGDPLDVHDVDWPTMCNAIERVAVFAQDAANSR